MRKTNIVATIGPATDSPDMIDALVESGVDIARINMSHAKADDAKRICQYVRDAAKKHNRPVGVLMDLQGPAIRTGTLPVDLDLNEGDTIALTVRGEVSEEEKSVDVNYDHLVDDIHEGDCVIVDNGLIYLNVLEKKHNQLVCRVLTGGSLGSRKHINLPGVRVQLPSLTDKDIEDVQTGLDLGVDFYALSFCREAKDVEALRAIIEKAQSHQKIVAKLEDQVGLSNLEAIIDAADGIMVARGDLGIEMPYEEIPILQRRIVKLCRKGKKPVIVATHMLESMIENPSPTRAEVTDVSNAVFEEADCIMLSGETSVGAYPERALEVMDTIARRIERSGGAGYSKDIEVTNDLEVLMKSGEAMADDLDADAIILFTKTGRMAANAAWFRPQTPVYAFTDDPKLVSQLTIYWGIEPYRIDLSHDEPSFNVEAATAELVERGILKDGRWVVIVSDLRVRGEMVQTIQMRKITTNEVE